MVSKSLGFIVFSILLIGMVSAWSIDIISPGEGINYDDNISGINWHFNGDLNISTDSCFYELNGASWTRFNCTDNISEITSIEGDNVWKLKINDSTNSVENTVNFWVDSIFPVIIIQTPEEDPHYTNSNTISISALLEETNPKLDGVGRAVLLRLYLEEFSFNNWTMDFNAVTNVSTFSYSPLSEGSYTYVLITEDTMGHSSNVSGEYILDVTAPNLTLNGNASITMEFNTSYIEQGATAIDSLEGNITDTIVIYNSTLNVSKIGSYNITYDVSDSAGNSATQLIRTVTIVDTTPPVINLTGANPQIIIIGNNYTELNATASDNYDGNLTSNIKINSSNVNTSKVGIYIVEYSVTDSFENTANLNRTVNVADNVAPNLTLIGNSTLTLEKGIDPYTELNATAFDNYDENLTANITIDSSNVNTSKVGSYLVYYYVEDSSGNNDTKTRIVEVVDTIAPSITILAPLDNTTYVVSTIDLKVISDEADVQWNYTLDDGITNITFTPNNTITGLSNRAYNLTVYITDASGNENSSTLSFTIAVPAPKGSSGGSRSCKSIWVCSEWTGWSLCEDDSRNRSCVAWEEVRCKTGITLDEVKSLVQTQFCVVPTPNVEESNLEVVAPIEEPEEVEQRFFARLTGNVVGFAKSGTGKIIVGTLAALSLIMGAVHFMRKRSSTILLE